MSFPGGTQSPSHNTSTGPMSFLGKGFPGVPQILGWDTPPARSRWGGGGYPVLRWDTTCPGQGRGVPHLHPIILPLVPCPFLGVSPGQLRMGYSPPPAGGTEGVLATRQAACLLGSRRRTFLFCYRFSLLEEILNSREFSWYEATLK